MTIDTMLLNLGTSLQDASELQFNETYKLLKLNEAQLTVARMLAPVYLNEIHSIKTNITATSGVMTIGSAALTYEPMTGGAGILSVYNVTNGYYYRRGEYPDVLIQNEQYHYRPSNTQPRFYVFADVLTLLPTVTSTINVGFLRQPATMTETPDVDCELHEDLHDLVVLVAESAAWRLTKQWDRSKAALEAALAIITTMNLKVGIGAQ